MKQQIPLVERIRISLQPFDPRHRAIGNEQIRPPVIVVVVLPCAKAGKWKRRKIQAVFHAAIGKLSVPGVLI